MKQQASIQAGHKDLLSRIDTLERELAIAKKVQKQCIITDRYFQIMDSIDQIVREAVEPEGMMDAFLEAVGTFFESDRVWVVSTYGPELSEVHLPYVWCRPEYHLARDEGRNVSISIEMKECIQAALHSKEPVVISSSKPIPLLESAQCCPNKHSLCAVLHPRANTTWLWGIDQCSYQQDWKQEDVQLFQEIGRRLSDVINCLLKHRQMCESEHKIRAILNNAQQFIGLLDIDGILIEVNQAALDLLDLKAEEVLGKYFWQAAWWVDSPAQQKRLQQAIYSAAKGQADCFEAHHTVLDGSVLYVICSIRPVFDQAGKVIYLVPEGRDITEHKLSEQALMESEQDVRTLLANSPDRISRIDRKGRVVFVNYSDQSNNPEEMIGTSFYDWVPLECHEAYRNCIDQVFKTGESCTFESQIRLSGGAEQWYENRLSPVVLDGEVESVLLTARDISRHKEITKEKEDLENQLTQAQKMEAVGRLAAGVAHDFNNLLSPILGYGEMLLSEFSKNDKRWEQIRQIHKAGIGARDLVRQLLAFGRKQSLEIKNIDLNTVVKNFDQLLRRTIRENVEIVIDLTPEELTVQADAGQLEQVVMNLAVNGQDSMPGGGKLVIRSEVVEIEHTNNLVPDLVEGSYALLQVADSGCGMTPEVVDQVFDPFFTTKIEGKGTGLGLATVYGIIKQHGGHVKVESEPGQGTIFSAYLPSVKEKVEHSEDSKKLDLVTGSETILIVEDEEVVLEIAEAILELSGYQVLTAQDTQQCLDLAKTHSGSIDLLLTDVVLPGMNCKELSEKVKECCPGIKILYMSGYSNEMIDDHGIVYEGVNFIQKPLSVEGLAAKVREVLDSLPV